MPIRFGSDGFRGVIGHGFTREAVARIALAAGRYARDFAPGSELTIPIGYDTRFLSREAAELAARLLLKEGFEVRLSSVPCPSPYLAFAAHKLGMPIGVQITASHNPSYYNGVKLKAGYGGSLRERDVKRVEQWANELELPAIPAGWPAPAPLPAALDLRKEYAEALLSHAGEPSMCALLMDYMHGASAPIYREILRGCMEVRAELRSAPDPLFGGSKPEPLAPQLQTLRQAVRAAGGKTLGLAFDGDGDRLAVIDETGQYLQSHEIFALLLDHLARSGHPGRRVVVTVSFSSLLARIADSHGLEVTETSVGFKHVSSEMLAGDVLLGGEESGGAALGHYLPERDALLMALTLLKARQEAGTTLREMIEALYSRFGRPHFVHKSVPLSSFQHAQLRERILDLTGLSSVAGESVVSVSGRDGVKLCTAAGWVLARSSGTEPLARFYAEADSAARAEAYIQSAQEVVLRDA